MKPIDRHERDVWELGRIVSAARLRCEDPACGIAGQNPDARFGRWCAENFGTHHRDTILNARRLWEVFGQRQAVQRPGLRDQARAELARRQAPPPAPPKTPPPRPRR